MALIKSCCHCIGLRTGSILCAIYSTIYFLIFSWFSGPTVIYETAIRLDDNYTMFQQGNLTELQFTPTSSFSSFVITTFPVPDFNMQDSIGYTLSVVDFISEILGLIASLVLMCGILKDKRSLMIPWLIVAPFHIIIDTCMVVYIVVGQAGKPNEGGFSWDAASSKILLLVFDVMLNTFTIYLAICITSQYQEYKAGRGTAAYEALNLDNRPSRASINNDNRSPNQSQIQTRGSQKSEVLLDDLALDKLDSTNEKSRNGSKKKCKFLQPPKSTYEAETSLDVVEKELKSTVRFDTSPSNDSKALLKPDSCFGHSSPSVSARSNYSSFGVEESTVEIADF